MAANLQGKPSNATSRPTTISRVLDKLSEVSGFNLNLKLPYPQATNPKNDRTYMPKRNLGTSPIMAFNLQTKISKILKSEQKLRQQKQQLIEDFRTWASSIANLECETMISEFGTLLLSQVDTNVTLSEKLDVLRLNLIDVHEREKKQKDLLVTKEKLLRQLKDSEAKFGPGASGSTLIKEKLEENVCNLEVVELQYLRSINKNLKESIIEYLVSLQLTTSILDEATQVYYGCLLAIEQGVFNNSNSHNNNGSNISGVNVLPTLGQSDTEGLRKTSPVKSRKDFIYQSANSGAVSSFRSQEMQKGSTTNSPSRKASSSPYDHTHQNGPPLCSECSKLEKYSRILTPCTHPSESRDTKEYSIVREYMPMEQWN
ncbi:hypothetical protein CLIB1423_10S00408 [[Candida] railenensis]|uniref:Uncharacterized protein n=1 Tax=[Candida] railenensis TaxID=45579 RepID=A0A9P0QR58_9ASCO|nr:hypothetical protein CLIB1423_10S00408 [[Candida] railenensis]